MIGRLLFWPAAAALLAVTAAGLSTDGLFSSSIWTPDGLKRMLWFAALYGCWAVLGGCLFPRWFTRITLAAGFIHTVAVLGVKPVAGVLYFLASAWALGSFAAPGVLGMLAGVAAYSVVIGLAVHFPVNYPAVYVGVMAIPLVLRRDWLQRGEAQVPGRGEFAAWALLSGILVMHLLMVLKPEAGVDALAMHLAIPASVEMHHQFTFDFRHTRWALMPMNANWAFTAVHLPGGEAATRLFNLSMLFATLALLEGLLRRLVSRPVSLLLTALFASSPIVQLVTGTLLVENYWAAMSVAAFTGLVCYRETGEIRQAYLAACFLGASLATKYGAFAFVVPAVTVLAWEIRCRKAWRRVPAVAALLVLFGSTPYVRALLASGNPVFPFFNHIFRSPHFDSASPFADPRFHEPLTLSTLYSLTFDTSRHYEGQNGGWGFHYLFFVPLALLVLPRRGIPQVEWAALGISLSYCVLTLAGQSNVRYLYPVLPLFMILAAGVIRAAGEWGAMRRRALIAAATGIFFLNVYFQPASGWTHGDFDVYTQDMAPVRTLIGHLNKEHGGEPAVFLETAQTAGLRGRAYTTSWHHSAFYDAFAAAGSVKAAARILKGMGVRHVVAPSDLKLVSLPAARLLLQVDSEPELEYMGWRVYRLGDARSKPVPVLSAGEYDDMDPAVEYEGQWAGDLQFAEAINGSVTYSAQPEALFRVRFRGGALTCVYTKSANRGIAGVFIDGTSHGTIDQYSGTTQWRQHTRFQGLGEGVHTLEVRVTGRSNPAATGAFVDLDQLIIH